MKKSLLIILLAIVFFSGSLFAKTVSVADAKNIATNFFKVTASDGRQRGSLTATLNYTSKEADNTVNFYVFDIHPGSGFVIVSADDVILPILGYSTEQNFQSDLNKTGLADWMKHASQHVYRGIRENLPATARTATLWASYASGVKPADEKSSAVAPMIFTQWNQEPYYNAYCPLNTAVTPNARAVTGCVATTMAQIMRYWSYPSKGTGSYSYNDATNNGYSNNFGTQSANFGATTYDWATMPISISSVNSGIATLMYQCGVSVAMDYGTDAQNGSGAQVLSGGFGGGGPCAQTAYATYFGYNPATLNGAYEMSYNATQWLNLIEADLNAGRPVQYIGEDQSAGGHTWVCDGYDGNGLLHMNWGWGGNSNGYFAVNSLSAGGYNFSSYESVLLGIVPLYPSTASAKHVSICQGDTTKLTARTTSHASYSWTPTIGLACPTCALTNATPSSTTVYIGRTDSAGISDTVVVVVSVTPRVSANLSSTNLTCYGASNGVVNINAGGGIPNYSYHWSNGLSVPSSNSLSAGHYVVTVTDGVGCKAVVSATLTQPAAIVATANTLEAGCSSATGTASVYATGGAGNLTYKWSTGNTDTTVTNLNAGVYKVTVTDSRNCTTVVDAVVAQPYQIEYSSSSTNTINGQYIGTASVDNITGGTAPYTFVWSDGQTSQTITGLEAGIYTVTITDHNGCYEVASDTIISTPAAGITNISDAVSFNVYPNPAHAQTMVQLSKFASGTTLKLENVLGQTLFSKTLTDVQTQLDLSAYADGVYFIEINQQGKKMLKQLVLNR